MDKIIEQKMCFDVLCNIYLKKKNIPRRIQRDMVINIQICSCKVAVILVTV